MAEECPICGNISLETQKGEFCFEPPPKVIPGGPIIISDATWEECFECEEKILSLDLERAIEKERYHRLGLLAPKDIHDIRQRAGLTQIEMAELLGVGEKTYTRWESGKSLQHESSDNLIRVFERDPKLFIKLKVERYPDRENTIAEYIKDLENFKGKNPLAVAAHGGTLDPTVEKPWRQRLLEILKLKRDL